MNFHTNLEELSSMGVPDTCPLSDDEEEFKPHECAMCSKTSGEEGDFMKRITDFHNDHVGQIRSLEIYAQCAEFYKTEYCIPMQRAGHSVSEISADQFKAHFEEHSVNPIRSIVEQIHTVEKQMRHVRNHGMRKKSGSRVTADPSSTKLYLQLGKQCQELYSQYVSLKSKLDITGSSEPPKFFTPGWN